MFRSKEDWESYMAHLDDRWEEVHLKDKKTEKPDIYTTYTFRDRNSKAWRYSNFHKETVTPIDRNK